MMTVQDAIRSLDKEELARAYSRIHLREIDPFYEEENVDEVTCGEIKKRTREKLAELIDLVCGLETREPENDRACIIFGYPYPMGSYYGEDIRHDLVYKDELLRQGEAAPGYAYSFTDWAEVLGYQVADTKYTQENLCKVMASVLYEMTWWGFTPEEVAKQRAETFAEVDALKAGEEEEDEEDAEFREDFMRGLEEAHMRDEARPLEEKLLERQYSEASDAYYRYLRGREIQEILEGLQRKRKECAGEIICRWISIK